MPNEMKNQRLKSDIQSNFPEGEAKLAMGILSMVENSDDCPNPEEIRKFAAKTYYDANGGK